MGRVEGKVAIVTGGAVGLGEAMCRMLAKEGAKVVVTDIKGKEGQAVAHAIVKAGGEAIYLEHDAASEADWERAIEETLARYGDLNVVVNNAGVALGATAEDTSLEDWRWLMSVNLDGVFLGTRYAIKAMKDRGGGSIVNLSSIEGIIGDPNLAAYNASKGGVRIFTKSAALHCAKSGYKIRVNSVHPGYIWTPMVEGYLRSVGDVDEGRKALDSLHPVGHVGEPDDIAFGVLYLASDESKFVTGAELVIDGGYTAQ
ncbi:glucose 1-dehydrogenase [Ferruginivarius sediminum]|uniref:SDR family NAD(P)-dependent oxidoreductase n=1 Tax=Ferruginivarius sediminum TaxID=2661937 RepID=A0A369T9S0_9PROT|nr:glucose 1-dehydrogenase [Ferruginivarius sediminum]RDD62040.1 SDR family NAD(P)-dependent oxidoreductase [Ferruginivarius sediminum]